jgi:hypothetical protein
MAENVSLLASPLGKTSGRSTSVGASNFSGSRRRFAGSSSSRASEPRPSAARPSFRPVEIESNHADE